MKKFVAQFNDGSYINTSADTMKTHEDMLFVYQGGELVAVADLSAVIRAHLSEVG